MKDTGRLVPLTAVEIELLRDALSGYARLLSASAVEVYGAAGVSGSAVSKTVRHIDGKRVECEMFRGDLLKRWSTAAKA